MGRPVGLSWRASTTFILATIGIVIFGDLFLFALIVPVLPDILQDRANVSPEDTQQYVSAMLAAFSASNVLTSLLVSWVVKKLPRKLVYLAGLVILALATTLLFTARTVPLLVISRAIQGGSASIVWVLGMTMCCETVGPQHLGKSMGTIYSFVLLGTMFAPTIGGSIYHFAGLLWLAVVAVAVIVLSFIMRLLVIEKPDAAKYEEVTQEASEPDEHTGLLSWKATDEFQVGPSRFGLERVPILCCFQSPSMVIAMAVIFWEAVLMSMFDATVPLHTRELFHFNAFKAGLMMVPVAVTTCFFGPLAGWAADHLGPKLLTVAGCATAGVGIVLLRLPNSDNGGQVALYACFLALCGLGMAMLDTPAVVETILLADRFHKQNPALFGDAGPYVQTNALLSIVFNIGMALGPVLSAALTDRFDYSVMTCVIGTATMVVGLGSLIWLGGRLGRKRE